MTQLITFSRDTVDGLARMVARLQSQVANTMSEMRRQNHVAFAEHVYAARTGASGIPALTGSTPGAATVTLYRINSSGGLEAVPMDATTDRTVTAYNLSSEAVAADTYIQIKREAATKKYLVDFEDCGS